MVFGGILFLLIVSHAHVCGVGEGGRGRMDGEREREPSLVLISRIQGKKMTGENRYWLSRRSDHFEENLVSTSFNRKYHVKYQR